MDCGLFWCDVWIGWGIRSERHTCDKMITKDEHLKIVPKKKQMKKSIPPQDQNNNRKEKEIKTEIRLVSHTPINIFIDPWIPHWCLFSCWITHSYKLNIHIYIHKENNPNKYIFRYIFISHVSHKFTCVWRFSHHSCIYEYTNMYRHKFFTRITCPSSPPQPLESQPLHSDWSTPNPIAPRGNERSWDRSGGIGSQPDGGWGDGGTGEWGMQAGSIH